MVWPPPKIEANQGEAPAETVERPASVPPGPSGAPATVRQGSPPEEIEGAVPSDWLQRPERLIGTVLGSRYRITAVIGRGPMGIACEGESSRARPVTLKLLPRPLDLPVEHFAWQVRQTCAMAHFDHANVSPITDFGSLDDGSAFVSRGRAPGVSLRALLLQGPLSMQRALSIARQICGALAAAHSQEIAHGRLKPENVIVQTGAPSGDWVRVVDFGMAGLPVNTPAVATSENEARLLGLRSRLYWPPNSYAPGGAPSPTSLADMYALGVILFEMIAGRPPFPFESVGPRGPEVAPLSFAQTNPMIQVPPLVAELVRNLLLSRGGPQTQSAEQVGQTLDSLLGRPSTAAGPPPLEPQSSRARERSVPPPALPERQPSVEPPATEKGPPPEGSVSPPAEPPQFWTPAEPSGSTLAWPSLPPQFSNSSIPPAPPAAPQQAPQGSSPPSVASGPYPPVPPSGASRPPPLPPQMLGGGSHPPPLRSPSSIPSAPPDSGDDELDADFRPSLMGRLKRLFGRKPSGDL